MFDLTFLGTSASVPSAERGSRSTRAPASAVSGFPVHNLVDIRDRRLHLPNREGGFIARYAATRPIATETDIVG